MFGDHYETREIEELTNYSVLDWLSVGQQAGETS